MVAQNLFGLTIGPVLTGFLADRIGLTAALAVVALLGAVAAAALWSGSRSYAGDRAAAAVTTGSPDRPAPGDAGDRRSPGPAVRDGR